jgi:hypothetical protein
VFQTQAQYAQQQAQAQAQLAQMQAQAQLIQQQNQSFLAQLQNQLGSQSTQLVVKSEPMNTTTSANPPGAGNLDDSSDIEVVDERSCKHRRTQPTGEVIDLS